MKTIQLILFLIPVFGISQNLVPNPSFEEYSDCPYSLAELETRAIGWYSWRESPDYYHTCNDLTSGFAGVPTNAMGYQWPIVGNAYAGLITYANYGLNIREYAAASLNSPLEMGQSYYVMFYVSQVEGEDGSVPNEYTCATNHLGLRFFKDPTYNHVDNPFEADNFAHVDYSGIIEDSINWTKVEGWFTADDNYNWVALGNFFQDEQTEILVQTDSSTFEGIYYLENICVSPNPADCDYLLSNEELHQTSTLSVFPNPFDSQIRIQLGINKPSTVAVFNIIGELIYTQQILDKEWTIDTTAWPSGLYFLRTNSEKYSTQQFKILKQ